MNPKTWALAGTVTMLICACQSAAQNSFAFPPGLAGVEPTFESSNLDIPPQEELQPEQVELWHQARSAVWDPLSFHERLLQLIPDRRDKEDLATIAILYPELFNRAHPKTSERLRAEAVAEHAVLNPHRHID